MSEIGAPLPPLEKGRSIRKADRVGISAPSGDQHLEQRGYDERLARFLKNKEIRVIRFWSIEVNENIDGICEPIASVVGQMTPTRNASHSDLHLSGGGNR